MGKYKKLSYKGAGHEGVDEEWGVHKNCSEWWYTTGCFHDESGRMYSFQFTLLRVKLLFFRPYIVMLALTDFESGQHHYFQDITLLSRHIIDENTVAFEDTAIIKKQKNGLRLSAAYGNFKLDLTMDYGKGAVWHCENGFLRMGIDSPGQTTIYYSYPNMPTAGTMTLNRETKTVKGKSWFDKQCGPFSLLNRKCMWEWFSLRFFDDEEMMLFSFPQSHYQDGTYIRSDGRYQRLINYEIIPIDFIHPDRRTKYSAAWNITVPGLKEEGYTIMPLVEGQMNMGYYELLAGVYNRRGEQVGLCFVELLPGVYNKRFPFTLLKKSGR